MNRHIFPAFLGLMTIAATTALSASAPAYMVDKTFDGASKTGIVYMDVMPDDSVCCLTSAGQVNIFDATGKALGSFVPELEGKPSSIAADKSGKIYVFSTTWKAMAVKRGKRTYERQMPQSSQFTVYDSKGTKEREGALAGVKQVKAARIIGNRIAVADPTQRAVVMLDSTTGEHAAKTEAGIRICCGIFDFCAGPNNSIMVANLGAFTVQSYGLDGTPANAFGKRGKSLNDFHGCCNPVSVAHLPGGGIVTAEKSPTRVKIYDATGSSARGIDGIDELVKGCSHIPMVADSKGNVYLASRNKGIVKCVEAQ